MPSAAYENDVGTTTSATARQKATAATSSAGEKETLSADIPVFDISIESVELGKKLVEGVSKWGFLWIIASPPPSDQYNDSSSTTTTTSSTDETKAKGTYDIDEETVNKVFEISREFFQEAPLKEKEACRVNAKDNKGWVDMQIENLDPQNQKRGDFKQAFNLMEKVDGNWQKLMPDTFKKSNNEIILQTFHSQCRNLTYRILRLLALGLDLPDVNWLVKSHERSPFTSRLLYYPKLPPDTDYNPAEDIRASSHSDYGTITHLFQRPGQGGLQILTPDGIWANVPVFPSNYHHSNNFPPVLVNIADLLSYWTNGLLKSTIHRVVIPDASELETTAAGAGVGLGEDRFSIAIFTQPTRDTEIVPMPSSIVMDRAAQFSRETVGHGGGTNNNNNNNNISGPAGGQRILTAGEYLEQRLKATYESVHGKQT